MAGCQAPVFHVVRKRIESQDVSNKECQHQQKIHLYKGWEISIEFTVKIYWSYGEQFQYYSRGQKPYCSGL